jgi:hypothetical protein
LPKLGMLGMFVMSLPKREGAGNGGGAKSPVS